MAKSNSLLGIIKSILCKLDYIEENCTVCMGTAQYNKKCKRPFTLNIFTIVKELEDKVEFIAENCFGCDEPPVSLLTGFSSSESATGLDVCSNPPEEATVTYYHDGEEATPQNGDTVYTDDQGENILAPSGWYSDGVSWYFVDAEGVVNRTLNCE